MLSFLCSRQNCCPIYCPTLIGPQGPMGPQGPQGPAGATTVESILVGNDGTQTVTANSLVNLGTVVNSYGANITFTSPSTITLLAGTYYIVFQSLVANSSSSGDVGASMQVNGVVVPVAAKYVSATTTQTQIVLLYNLTVTSATTITILNASTVSNIYHDPSLSVLKLV